jgi:hypothetical protein
MHVPRLILIVPLFALAVLAVQGHAGSHAINPHSPPRVAPSATTDTLRPTVDAGQPLILALPAERDSVRINRYRLIRGPALSGVVGRSFAWVTQPADAGRATVLLRPVGRSPLPDTLALVITVRAN